MWLLLLNCQQMLASGRFQGLAGSRIPAVEFIATGVAVLVEVELHGIQAQDLFSLLFQFLFPVFDHVGHRHVAPVFTRQHFDWEKLFDFFEIRVSVES